METDILSEKNLISGNEESTTTERSAEDLSANGSTEDIKKHIADSMPKFGLYPVNNGNALGPNIIHDVKEKSTKVENVIIKAEDMTSGNEESTIFPTNEWSSDEGLSATEDIQKYITDSMPKFGIYPGLNLESFKEAKKIDENANGNALGQTNLIDIKKKKKSKKNKEVVHKAENVEGHRGDIIQDIDKLLQFINGDEEKKKGTKHKTQKNVPEEKGKQHKQRTRSSKSTKTSGTTKNNSTEKICEAK